MDYHHHARQTLVGREGLAKSVVEGRLSLREAAAELGSETTVSLILSGKRQLTREHIARLSRRFHVEPSVFFPKR